MHCLYEFRRLSVQALQVSENILHRVVYIFHGLGIATENKIDSNFHFAVVLSRLRISRLVGYLKKITCIILHTMVLLKAGGRLGTEPENTVHRFIKKKKKRHPLVENSYKP
jgi:hypothetical protein